MKKTVYTIVCVFVLAGLTTACESEIDNKPAAKVEEAAKPTETAKKAVEEAPAKEMPGNKMDGAAVYTLDLATSTFSVVGAKVTGDHTLTFKEMTATADVDSGKVKSGKVTVQMASVEADVEKLTGHLKSPDFFDVANHPTSTFEIVEVKEGTSAAGTHEVVGNLTMRGASKKVTFPADIKMEGDAASIKAQFTINRKDFNIVYAGKADDLIKDDVLIKLELKFKKG